LFIYLVVYLFIYSYSIHCSRAIIGNDSESRNLAVGPVYVAVTSRCVSEETQHSGVCLKRNSRHTTPCRLIRR